MTTTPASKPTVPHPFPYQGSKRAICDRILAHVPAGAGLLVKPFCGSAAVSLAVAAHGRAERFWLNDANAPLIALWREILERPMQLADRYERLWREQLADKKAFFFQVRREFNETHAPDLLLYLLARIVKGSVRYSADGRFNQSADNRRWGMRPKAMRLQLLGVSAASAGRTKTTAEDFRSVVAETTADDVIYMDPPYQGTSRERDPRYYASLRFAEFVDALGQMNKTGKSYIVSYDGKTGDKQQGEPLPARLNLRHLHVRAGRSSQSTLLGRDCETVESLYLSPALVERLDAGENRYEMQSGSIDDLDFNEAPAERGGKPGHPTRLECGTTPSMRPPLNAGENHQAEGNSSMGWSPFNEAPAERGGKLASP